MNKMLPAYPAWRWFPWKSKSKPVKPTGPIITGAEAQRMLQVYFRYVFVKDRRKYIAQPNQLVALWREKGVGRASDFIDDDYDCDNMARDALGVANRPDQKPLARQAFWDGWVQKPKPHEIIVFIDAHGVGLADPQSKQITRMTKDRKGYHVA